MAKPSLRARLARWIGGSGVESPERARETPGAPEEGAPNPEDLPLLERVRALEAEMLDLSTQWADLNDAVRKWSARLASQKAAETRKALAAMGETGNGDSPSLDGQLEPSADDPDSPAGQAARAKVKAELNRRWLARRGR